MKQHSKEFEKEITLLGKQQVVQITYGDVVLTSEDINSATPSYEANLLKSVMKSLVLDSNKDIPLRTESNFKYHYIAILKQNIIYCNQKKFKSIETSK